MKCGNCGHATEAAATVNACYAGERAACHWMVEVPGRWVEYGDEGDYVEGGVEDCGAHVTFTDRGWTCEAGHEFVRPEARHAEGWDYAEDFGEAKALAAAGVEPLTMSGHVVLGPQSFAGV